MYRTWRDGFVGWRGGIVGKADVLAIAIAVILTSAASAQPIPSPGDLLVCGSIPGWSGIAHVDLTNNVEK